MKKILVILVLGLFLITPSQADDISDFQIEGISIRDSALKHFNANELTRRFKDLGLPPIVFVVINSIASARSGENDAVISSLTMAINMDTSYKSEALIDLEFINLRAIEAFITLTK